MFWKPISSLACYSKNFLYMITKENSFLHHFPPKKPSTISWRFNSNKLLCRNLFILRLAILATNARTLATELSLKCLGHVIKDLLMSFSR